MKDIFSILNKVLVREFYRANAGLLFFVIGVGVGFMRSEDHIALAESFVSSPMLILIPISVWVIYSFIVIQFNGEILKRKENEFIFHFMQLPRSQKWFTLTTTLFYQLLPTVLYGVFLMVIALKHNALITFALALGALLLLVMIGSITLSYALHHPNQEKKVGQLAKILNVSITKPYPIFFPEWIARREPFMLLGTKIFTCLILLGVTQLYKTDVYDIRLMGLGMVIAFSAQVVLVWEIHRFDNFNFTLNQNLPIHIIKRLIYFLITSLTLMIPELGMILKGFPTSLNSFELCCSILFSLSIPVFFYGLLYTKERDQEKFMPFVFFFSISWILLVLFKIPLWAIASFNLFIGVACLKKFYYSFEYVSKQEG